jgi:hypothetical protein
MSRLDYIVQLRDDFKTKNPVKSRNSPLYPLPQQQKIEDDLKKNYLIGETENKADSAFKLSLT